MSRVAVAWVPLPLHSSQAKPLPEQTVTRIVRRLCWNSRTKFAQPPIPSPHSAVRCGNCLLGSSWLRLGETASGLDVLVFAKQMLSCFRVHAHPSTDTSDSQRFLQARAQTAVCGPDGFLGNRPGATACTPCRCQIVSVDIL